MFNLRPSRVCVLTGDSKTAGWLSSRLDSAHMVYNVTGTPRSCAEAISALLPDVIVCDPKACTPDMRAVLNILRSACAGRPVPILFLTDSDDDPSALGALLAGAEGLLRSGLSREATIVHINAWARTCRQFERLLAEFNPNGPPAVPRGSRPSILPPRDSQARLPARRSSKSMLPAAPRAEDLGPGGFEGSLGAVSINSLLLAFESEFASGELELRIGKDLTKLTLQGGSVSSVELNGAVIPVTAAIANVLDAKEGMFRFRRGVDEPKPSHLPTTATILTAARRLRDAERRSRASLHDPVREAVLKGETHAVLPPPEPAQVGRSTVYELDPDVDTERPTFRPPPPIEPPTKSARLGPASKLPNAIDTSSGTRPKSDVAPQSRRPKARTKSPSRPPPSRPPPSRSRAPSRIPRVDAAVPALPKPPPTPKDLGPDPLEAFKAEIVEELHRSQALLDVVSAHENGGDGESDTAPSTTPAGVVPTPGASTSVAQNASEPTEKNAQPIKAAPAMGSDQPIVAVPIKSVGGAPAAVPNNAGQPSGAKAEGTSPKPPAVKGATAHEPTPTPGQVSAKAPNVPIAGVVVPRPTAPKPVAPKPVAPAPAQTATVPTAPAVGGGDKSVVQTPVAKPPAPPQKPVAPAAPKPTAPTAPGANATAPKPPSPMTASPMAPAVPAASKPAAPPPPKPAAPADAKKPVAPSTTGAAGAAAPKPAKPGSPRPPAVSIDDFDLEWDEGPRTVKPTGERKSIAPKSRPRRLSASVLGWTLCTSDPRQVAHVLVRDLAELLLCLRATRKDSP